MAQFFVQLSVLKLLCTLFVSYHIHIFTYTYWNIQTSFGHCNFAQRTDLCTIEDDICVLCMDLKFALRREIFKFPLLSADVLF